MLVSPSLELIREELANMVAVTDKVWRTCLHRPHSLRSESILVVLMLRNDLVGLGQSQRTTDWLTESPKPFSLRHVELTWPTHCKFWLSVRRQAERMRSARGGCQEY